MSFVFLLVLISASQGLESRLNELKVHGPDIKIGFGSCFQVWEQFGDGVETNDIFAKISRENLDVYTWLGDAYYGDKLGVGIILGNSS